MGAHFIKFHMEIFYLAYRHEKSPGNRLPGLCWVKDQ